MDIGGYLRPPQLEVEFFDFKFSNSSLENQQNCSLSQRNQQNRSPSQRNRIKKPPKGDFFTLVRDQGLTSGLRQTEFSREPYQAHFDHSLQECPPDTLAIRSCPLGFEPLPFYVNKIGGPRTSDFIWCAIRGSNPGHPD